MKFLLAATLISMVLPTERTNGVALPADLELMGLVYRCTDDEFLGLAIGLPGGNISVEVADRFGCWYARAQIVEAPSPISSKSQNVLKQPPCNGCHNGV